MARTRIVATVGPASTGEVTLAALADAGVDVFRLNFSHGTHAEHAATIAAIRRLAGPRPIAILQDLGGPKLRLRHPVRGRAGDVVALALPATVRPGDPVLLADGLMQLEVVGPDQARVLVGGDIPAGKGINLPSSRLDLPSLTEKDRADLRFGIDQGVDLIAVSFVRRGTDLEGARVSDVPLVAKIETAEAVSNMREIVAAADGVMVARGALGVEIAVERVPIVQKELIALANGASKPVITATPDAALDGRQPEPDPRRGGRRRQCGARRHRRGHAERGNGGRPAPRRRRAGHAADRGRGRPAGRSPPERDGR
jgi:pyruvate kinase